MEKQSSAVARRRRSPPSVAASFLRQSKFRGRISSTPSSVFFSDDVSRCDFLEIGMLEGCRFFVIATATTPEKRGHLQFFFFDVVVVASVASQLLFCSPNTFSISPLSSPSSGPSSTPERKQKPKKNQNPGHAFPSFLLLRHRAPRGAPRRPRLCHAHALRGHGRAPGRRRGPPRRRGAGHGHQRHRGRQGAQPQDGRVV